MIIDAHTHIFPPDVIVNRSTYTTPDEEACCLIYDSPHAKMVGAEELIAAMDEGGIDMSVVCGFPWRNEDSAIRHNDYILEAQTRYPDRLIGLSCVDPLQEYAEREVRRCLAAGLRGVGELAVYCSGFDDHALSQFTALADICRQHNAPLMVHVNEPIGHIYPGKAPLTLGMIYNLAKTAQGVDLILAHWGGGLLFYDLLKKEVPSVLDRVYFDTAASPYLYRREIYPIAAKIVGPGKILFGSDFPLLKPARYFKEMDEAGLDAETMEIIKGKAADKLFNCR